MNFETENIEFKSQFTEEIYKEVIAFANTDGGVVYVGSTGSFTMNDGVLTGCTAVNGGGVYVEGSTFTMNGGIISNVTATRDGAVCMSKTAHLQ